MSSITLEAPAMYADHHVLKAREALLALEGVEEVVASSAWQVVIVSYNPDQVKPAEIEETLSKAGYASDKTTPILAQSAAHFKDPAWEAVGTRITETNQVDLEISGEFRKY